MSGANAVDLGAGSCFCLITGASRGIGRAIAVECAKHVGANSLFLLLARDERGLLETKSSVESAASSTPNVEVLTRSVDLSHPADAFKDIFADISPSDFDLAMIVHNVGSVGELERPARLLGDAREWRSYYDLNVFGVAALNAAFLQRFNNRDESTVVVNVTSLCGIKPFAGLAYYGSGKAAREMYFRVLAEECPRLRVLNYSPGPVRTAMVQGIIDGAAAVVALKENFVSMRDEGKLLEPEQTAAKFVRVLTEGKYASGDHVDYFD